MKKTKEEILSQHLHEVENGVHSCQDKVCDVVEEIKAAMEEYAAQSKQDKEEQRLYAVFSVYGDDFTRRSIWFNSKNEAESYKNDNRMVRREYVIFEKTLINP